LIRVAEDRRGATSRRLRKNPRRMRNRAGPAIGFTVVARSSSTRRSAS
jgi:hypothetical protein